MKRFNIFLNQIVVLILALIYTSCSGPQQETQVQSSINEAEILLNYLEENGNIVNDTLIPYFVNAVEVFANLNAGNYHIIDVRPVKEFKRGHIPDAINIQPENILDYFEKQIEPNSFEKIAIVCNNAQLSGYVVSVLRMLGYNNTFNMRFGMSSWNESVARRSWSANISDDLIGRLEIAPHPKNEPGALPVINTGKTNGYDILRAQAQKALEVKWSDVGIDYIDALENKDNYYIINYWPEALYNQGHLPGSVQYAPKKAFHSQADIYTLPTDKPIVVYCFTGQNAAYANGFLAVMGYSFKSLDYGANSFMHATLKVSQPAGRVFSDNHIKNFPLERDGLNSISTDAAAPAEIIDVTTAAGGC
jgi:rhodanese-related sulfurtransferase